MSTNENIVFVRSSAESGRLKVRPLPGQTMLDEDAGKIIVISTSKNVNSESLRKHAAPIGSTFALTEGLTVTGQFYRPNDLGDIYVVSSPDKKDIDAPDSLMDLFRQYRSSAPKEDVEEIPEPAKPKVTTTYQLLKKKYPVPDPNVAKFYIDEDTWYHILINAQLRKNIMFVGPTGCGKTEVFSLITEMMKRVGCIFDMGTMQDPMSGLLGTHRLKDGKSIFDPSRFSQVIQKPNMNILLDEISRAPFTANNILFPVMDKRRKLYVEVADGEAEREINVHEKVVFFATANIGVEYTGTGEIDRALKDRFNMVELDYMPKETEIKMLVIRHEVANSEAGTIASVAELIRNLAKKGDLSTSVSTRHTLDAAELVSHGYDLKKAMMRVFLPVFEGQGTNSERTVVQNMILTR